MSDKKFELSRRNALLGLGAVGAASTGAGLGTSAYFSDQEVFEENSLTAGELDLYAHYETSVDQNGAGTGSATGSGTIQGDPAIGEYAIDDVKPGDSGHLQFCFSIVDNPAFLRMSGELTANDENGQTEPEALVDETGGDPGEGDGELADAVEATLSYCDEDGEPLSDSVLRSGSLRNVLSALRVGVPLDAEPGSADRTPFEGGEGSEEPTDETCVCLEWAVPTTVGNEIQTDSVGFDLSFYGEQSRHNDGIDLASGLVGYWPLDTVEDGVAEDVSGNGNDGAVTGDVASVGGQVAKAAAFDGDEDYVEVSQDLKNDFGSEITIAAWVSADVAGQWRAIAALNDTSNGGNSPPALLRQTAGSSWQLFVDTSNGTSSATGGSVSTDTWVHVTGTYDGSHVKLFVDGEEEASQAHSGALDDAVDGLLHATWQKGGNGDLIQHWNGKIDDVRIYDRALSEAEVTEIYERTS